jgi:hypothetical protein
MTIARGTSGATAAPLRLGALWLILTMAAGAVAGCATEGRAVTVQEECMRGGGVWPAASIPPEAAVAAAACEGAADGGGGGGSAASASEARRGGQSCRTTWSSEL